MSADDAGQREIAYRLFAAEYDDADYSYSESDEERAPNYVVTPTGARVNRLFAVGVLTEVEQVSDDVLRARVADPTGAFVLYAGQYQPDEQAFLERTDPPAFVAVTGKARTFQPDDSDRVYTSVRPESINEVDAGTRDRWTVQAAEQTLDRVANAATALSTGLSGDSLREALVDRGVDDAHADGLARALDHYDTTPAYLDALREVALDAARVVAGERDGVRDMTVAPDEPGDVTATDLATTAVDLDAPQANTDTGTPGADGVAADDGDTAVHLPTDQQEVDTPAADDNLSTHDGTTTADGSTGSESVETGPETGEEPGTAAARSGTDRTENGHDHDEQPTAGSGAEADPVGEVDDLGEFDADEFDLSDEVREEVEEEYGTEFKSGTEVDEPGEADIETPDVEADDAGESDVTPDAEVDEPDNGDVTSAASADDTVEDATDDAVEDATDDAVETGDEADTATGDPDESDAGASDDAAEGTDEGDSPEDPQAAVLAVMSDLDEGGGADREAVVEAASERHGLTAEAVEDAIQGALMDGQCYEPDETSLKPI